MDIEIFYLFSNIRRFAKQSLVTINSADKSMPLIGVCLHILRVMEEDADEQKRNNFQGSGR